MQKIGLTIPDYDFKPPRNRSRPTEIEHYLEIFTVLSAQIELREEAVLSTNKILKICVATIKRIENQIPTNKECLKLLETGFMSTPIKNITKNLQTFEKSKIFESWS